MTKLFVNVFLSILCLLILFSVTFPLRSVNAGLSSVESQIVGLVDGTRAYTVDLGLEQIAYNQTLSDFSFRSGGSKGANATADWILQQFQNLGLEAYKEQFQFTTWNVPSRPSLTVDDDGDNVTVGDQSPIDSFVCEHYSLPTPSGGVFADLVVLPLPPAATYSDVGSNPINTTEWNAINTTGKVVLIGKEVRWVSFWESVYVNKLTVQRPVAVIYCYWYDWMSHCPAGISSVGGRPFSSAGPYYWNLGIPVGSLGYEAGLWIRNREKSMNVSASVRIDSVIGSGPHYNVIGKLLGYKYPDKYVIVSSHYDTIMASGFCDNGAGTAGVLELARVFVEANSTGLFRPKYTMLFVAWADEEMGFVGAINYVIQHKSEMSNIVAVINLDCIGSDDFYVSRTDPGSKFDLDQLVFAAAQDLGIPAAYEDPGASDQEVFRDPAWANGNYMFGWGLDAGIADAVSVPSSGVLISYPLVTTDLWNIGSPGWIHTPYDNSTSTSTLRWVEVGDLENHIKIAALSLSRVVAPNIADINNDGFVDMKDVDYAARRFGITASDPLWDPIADTNKDNKLDMKDIGTVARHFGETDT